MPLSAETTSIIHKINATVNLSTDYCYLKVKPGISAKQAKIAVSASTIIPTRNVDNSSESTYISSAFT